jgi:hypothetical protein
MTLTFNADALHSAATAAGDVKPDGDLSYTRIGRRAGIDIAVVSRVHRRINGPDLKTALCLARAYNLTVEDLVSIETGQALAA